MVFGVPAIGFLKGPNCRGTRLIVITEVQIDEGY